jgi:hypothetical protein
MVESSPVALFGLARLRRNSDWQKLNNWDWRARIVFVSHGVQTAIQVTEPAALVPVRLRLPSGSTEIEDSTAVAADYSLVVGNQVAPPGVAGLHLLFRDNVLMSAAYKLDPVLGALESELDGRIALLAAPQRIFMRAGVVGWRGRAILITGAVEESERSALVAALLRAGGSYYSDRYAVLDADGRVHPYARPLWLGAGAQAYLVRYRAEDLGAKEGKQALEIGTLVFAYHRAAQEPRFIVWTRSLEDKQPMDSAVPSMPALREVRSAIGRALPGICMSKVVAVLPYLRETQSAVSKAMAGNWVLTGVRGEAGDVVTMLKGSSGDGEGVKQMPAAVIRPPIMNTRIR